MNDNSIRNYFPSLFFLLISTLGFLSPEVAAQARVESPPWVLDLYLSTGNGAYRDLNNRIGVANNTSDGMDGLDALFFSPNADEFGVLYFPHEDWSPAANLDYDYRSNEWEEQLWEFQVWDQNVSGDWNLRWPNISNVPGNIRLSITSLDTSNVLIPDLRSKQKFSFSLTSGSKRTFILKAMVIADTKAPNLLAGFVRNPLLENYVDLYLYPDEPLGDLAVFVNAESVSPQINENNYNIYRVSFHIDAPGTHEILYVAEDLAGYRSEDTIYIYSQSALGTGQLVSPR